MQTSELSLCPLYYYGNFMDFQFQLAGNELKSETLTHSWKKGNSVDETSFKEVRYP